MGEIIRVMDRIKIGNIDFDIELNHGTESCGHREIHIQNEKFRLAMSEPEFLQLATSILLARKQFEIIKKKNYE